MATETTKYLSDNDQESRHSALAEFSRDERRPAVLLLSALLIAVLFFGLGLLIGRWTALPDAASPELSSNSPVTPSITSSPQPAGANNVNVSSAEGQRKFAVLVATYDAQDKSQPLIKSLEAAGYKDVRSTSARGADARPRFSVLVGRYTQDEAREAVSRMRAANDPRLKNARVVDAN